MAYEKYIISVSLESESDMSDKQYTAVKVSNPFKCDTATKDSEVAGIVVNNPVAGMAATIVNTGVTKIKVANGKTVTAGKGVTFTAGEASGNGNYGICLETVTGPGLATIMVGCQKVAESSV